MFQTMGVTFNVYGDHEGGERIFPFDPIPRIISAQVWAGLEAGLIQRARALNAFIADIYSEAQIVKDGTIPRDLVIGSPQFRHAATGIQSPCGVFITVAGIDLVRGADGRFHVLEDNVRTPSGVSYVVENRRIMTRLMPELIRGLGVRSVENYPAYLLSSLRELDQKLFMKTVHGPRQIHVLYRRIDDDFLDPVVFRSDSLLGVAGLTAVLRAGNATLANAIGTGVADDKGVFAYTPAMIRYYLGEEPLLPIVETYLMRDPEVRKAVLRDLDHYVIKPTGASGGYGVVIGPKATDEELEQARQRIEAAPDGFIAQPVFPLSVHPTLSGGTAEGKPALVARHVDLRPFVLLGAKPRVLAGGLTRVALREGSLIVNSSQGGGSKDTWVLEE
jgi:uncharacterized circularly permuted ATP-grasp superfamily protein